MKPGQKHFVVYANVSEIERRRVREQANAEGVSISEYVRRAINELFMDAGVEPLRARRSYESERAL